MATDKKPWLNRKERKEWARRLQSVDPGLEVVHPHAAGIDVGNGAHYVAVRPDRDPEPVRLEARRELLVESHKHAAVKLLRQIPSIGPIRAALLVALLQTPHRFRTKPALGLQWVRRQDSR